MKHTNKRTFMKHGKIQHFFSSSLTIFLAIMCLFGTITSAAAFDIDSAETSAQLDDLIESGVLAEAPTLSFGLCERGISMEANLPSNSIWNYRFYVWKNGTWARIGKDTKLNRCTYSTNEGGCTYYFTVRAVYNNRFLTNYKKQSVYYCNTPGSLMAAHISRGIKVSWDKCYGVTKYRVYWLNTKGEWVRETDTYNNYYIDRKPKKDWMNYYTVRGLDSDGDWCTGYKTFGCGCYQGGPSNTSAVVNNIINNINTGNTDFTYPDKYWKYSNLPEGADWCTGFCNYVIGESCGHWRFAGKFHYGSKFNWNYEEEAGTSGYYNNPADWHPYTNQWARWAADDDIFYQPYELTPSKGDIVFFVSNGTRDSYSAISHVGIVVSANSNSVTTLEGNTGNNNASSSRVNYYTYTKSGGKFSNNYRYISGYIRMKDIYYRTIYD